jgi:hypothetical protein
MIRYRATLAVLTRQMNARLGNRMIPDTTYNESIGTGDTVPKNNANPQIVRERSPHFPAFL